MNMFPFKLENFDNDFDGPNITTQSVDLMLLRGFQDE